MNSEIKLVEIESKDKSVLQNLFQLYMHDITASLPMDVNEHGLFEYNYLDYYFAETEGNRHAYFVYILTIKSAGSCLSTMTLWFWTNKKIFLATIWRKCSY